MKSEKENTITVYACMLCRCKALECNEQKMTPKEEEIFDLSPLSPSPSTYDVLPTSSSPSPKPRRLLLPLWITLNTLATIGIVFVNHHLFTTPLLLHAQMLYAAYHFFLTFSLLTMLSLPSCSRFFQRKVTVSWKRRVPLAIAMGTQVVLPNMSNGYSSVMFYQVARILLTPTVAGLNYYYYNKKIPRRASYALIAQCAGVFILAYFDSRPSSPAPPSPYQYQPSPDIPQPTATKRVETTSALGVFFSFAGVLASSLYTIWVAEYHKRWDLSSMQLLHNQSWLGGLLLMYGAPFEISMYLKGRTIFAEGGLEAGAWWGILTVWTLLLIQCLYAGGTSEWSILMLRFLGGPLRMQHQHLSILHH